MVKTRSHGRGVHCTQQGRGLVKTRQSKYGSGLAKCKTSKRRTFKKNEVTTSMKFGKRKKSK